MKQKLNEDMGKLKITPLESLHEGNTGRVISPVKYLAKKAAKERKWLC